MAPRSKRNVNPSEIPKTPRSVGKTPVPPTPKSNRPLSRRLRLASRLLRRPAVSNSPACATSPMTDSNSPTPSEPTPVPSTPSTQAEQMLAPSIPSSPVQNVLSAQAPVSSPPASSTQIGPTSHQSPELERANLINSSELQLPFDPFALLPDAPTAPIMMNAGAFPTDCPLCEKSCTKKWLFLRHLISCFEKYRKTHKKVSFSSIYNVFNPMLKKNMLTLTEVVDLLKIDFLEELNKLGLDKSIGETFYSCKVDPDCRHRCLERADILRHHKCHLSKKADSPIWHICPKCKLKFRNISNYNSHINRKTSCVKPISSEPVNAESES